jgi:Transcriptional regulator PadR-like family
MRKTTNALLHGSLDALILKTLAGGPRHGYAIAKYIEDASGDTVTVEEGSLYPALYRMGAARLARMWPAFPRFCWRNETFAPFVAVARTDRPGGRGGARAARGDAAA